MMELSKLYYTLLRRKFTLKSIFFLFLSLGVITLITVYPLFNTGLACGDDISSYLISRLGKVFSNAKNLAEQHGRFHYYFVLPFQGIAFFWDNMFVIKLFQVLPILLAIYLFYRIVLVFSGSQELSLFYMLLFLVTAQVSRYTNAFVTYPLVFSFSFSILLGSLLTLIRYQKTQKYQMLILSTLLFAIGLLCYETYLLFFLFAGCSVLYNNFRKGYRGRILARKVTVQVLPFFIVAVCYLAVYMWFSHNHLTVYDGRNVSDSTTIMKSLFPVIWRLAYTAFPLTIYTSAHSFFEQGSESVNGFRNVIPFLFANARVEWIVKSVLVLGVSYYLLIRIPKISYQSIFAGILAAVMLIFLPHLPLALTEKYIFYVMTQNMNGYVTTFFSLFGVVLFITLLSALLMNLTSVSTLPRHILAFVISFGLVLCSFLTDFSNYYITRDIDRASTRLYVIDELVKSDRFKAIPENSIIYGADLWNNPSTEASNLTAQNFQWSLYVFAKSGIKQQIFYNDTLFLAEAKKYEKNCYQIIYNQSQKSDEAYIVIGEFPKPVATVIHRDSLSNKLLVSYFSPYKYFRVSFRKNPCIERSKIQVNHIRDTIDPGEYVEFAVYNTKINERATTFSIEAEGVDIRTLHISNIINRNLRVYYQ